MGNYIYNGQIVDDSVIENNAYNAGLSVDAYVANTPGLKRRRSQQEMHRQAQERGRQALKQKFSEATGLPSWGLGFTSRFVSGTLDIASGVFKAGELGVELLQGMDADQMRKDGLNPFSAFLDEKAEFFNQFETNYYDASGKALTIEDLIKQKEYGKAARLAAEQALESAPSMLASIVNPVLGGAVLGISTTGGTFKDDLVNRPDQALDDIIGNALWAGGSEMAGEMVGGKLFRAVNKLDPTKENKKLVKELTQDYLTRFIGRTFGSSTSEAVTEAITSTSQIFGEDLFYGDQKTAQDYLSGAINSMIPALMLGGFGGGISGVQKADRNKIFKAVATNKWKQEYLKIGKQVYDASFDVEAATNEKEKRKQQKRLKDLRKKQTDHETGLYERFENMSDFELNSYAENLDNINTNLGIINSNRFTFEAQESAKKENEALYKENLNILGEKNDAASVKIEQDISQALKASEIIQERLKKVKGINRDDLDIKILKTDEQVAEAVRTVGVGAGVSDGLFIGKNAEGKATIYINEKVSSLAGATNVLGHELLHYMISRKFKTDNKSMRPLIDSLKKYLQQNHADVYSRVQSRIDKYYTDKRGIKKGALEEYLNIFSDLVSKERIDLKELESQGLRNGVTNVMKGFGFGQVKLDTAQDLIRFIKMYNDNINRKGLLGKIMGTKILDIDIVSNVLTERDTKAEAKTKKASRSNLQNMLDTDYAGDVKKMGSEAVSVDNEGRRLTVPDLTKSKLGQDIGAMVENITKRLFDPILEKGDLTRGEYKNALISIASEIIRTENFDPTIQSLDKFVSSRLYARANRLASDLGVPQEFTKDISDIQAPVDEAAPVEDTIDDTQQVGGRVLSNFDINLEDGSVDAEIMAQIEDLLSLGDFRKKEDDKLQQKLDKLVVNEFRKLLDNSVGKIAKNPETGNIEATPEYETFIREEFNEIKASLDIETVRKLPWFKKTKIDRKDYKNIDPVTGKVSNYRKDVFEIEAIKPEYIKYYTKGKAGVLRERRRALLIRIAERKAQNAVDSYIEQNSNSIDNIVKSKLRKLSKTEKRITAEDKSFDNIKFSKSIDVELNDIIENSTKKGKRYLDYTNPYTGKTQNFADIGRVWEQAMANYFDKMKIPGLEVISKTASESGGMADFVFRLFGVDHNHELKAGIIGPYMGSTLFSSFNIRTGDFTLANPIHENIPGLKRALKNKTLKAAQDLVDLINQEIKKYNAGEGVYKTKPKTKVKEISGNIVKGKPQRIPDVVYKQVGKLSPTAKFVGQPLTINNTQPIKNHYIEKNVFDATFLGVDGKNITVAFDDRSILTKGSKPAPMLEGKTSAEIRLRTSGSQMIDGVKMRSFQLGIQFKLLEVSNKNTPDITKKQDFLDMTPTSKKSITSSDTDIGLAFTNAHESARSVVKQSVSRGMSTFDFDETLIDKGENFVVAKDPVSGDEIRISSEAWPVKGPELTRLGYEFDFNDFVNVRGGVEGPLLQKMRNQIEKFGPANVYVLTARPQESATAIHEWLKSKNINIPIENITGLGNSTGEAKAKWMLEKFAEGYNDMYFVDDALSNVAAVKGVLEQLDIKSNVQQVRIKRSQSHDGKFNKILQDLSGIDAQKRFSAAAAKKLGTTKGKFRFFIPPSHEDFVGLLYNFIGKGELGNEHRQFFEDALIKPLNKAFRELNSAKQVIASDYRGLLKQFPEIRKKLNKATDNEAFTFEDAVRVYLWDKNGISIPGISKAEQSSLVSIVKADLDLQNFADTVGKISRQKEGYIEAGEHWTTGNIKIDLSDATGRVGRAKFFTEFQENADIIFSQDNLNKIQAIYGNNFREALEDMLTRIKTGSNRTIGGNRLVNTFLDYLNGSVGATMFFNARSAVLQTLSTVNFINFGDNNIFKASAAFANQPQFWSDFVTLFNSDMLKQRRAGVAFDINANEIATMVRKSGSPVEQVRAATRYLLQKGFLPTQIADSFAISFGGATMYRNRINTYLKQGLQQAEAEKKAFADFQTTAESTQQSARPDMISQQQASPLGRMILAFQNVTSQYARLIKKSGLDLINRRKSPPYTTQVQSDMANISKIVYYGAVQNAVFYALQTALFSMMYDDEERDEEFFDTKKDRILQGSIDSILRGMGVGGAVISTIKNTAMKYAENQNKGWGREDNSIMMELLQLSPPIGIKGRKFSSGEKTLAYNKKVIKEMETFDFDNPLWGAVTNFVEAGTNIPVARLHRKITNLREALNAENQWWQRLAVGLGWSTWDVGIENRAIEDVKKQIKQNNEQVKKDATVKRKIIKRKVIKR